VTFETLPPIEGQGMGINYGFDKVRFMAPVKSGARIRAHFSLADVNVRPSGCRQQTNPAADRADAGDLT
jgi:acyl dehydratase